MHLTAPPVLHPASSLLGRIVRRWTADARQAGSIYIVAVALIAVVMALAVQWGWMLGQAHPVAYSVAVGLGWSSVGAACLAGWRPRLDVRVGGGVLHVVRGPESLVIPLGQIEACACIPAEAYHQHWRRYAATRTFVNRLGDEVLLVRTARGPVVLGLAPPDLLRLETYLGAYVAHDRLLCARAA